MSTTSLQISLSRECEAVLPVGILYVYYEFWILEIPLYLYIYVVLSILNVDN